ncbi:hypothetical protein [Lyngbya aestuarii]|uniref:hypothetical protein n=1 Tax=Lyngbya aestuarii TaxID=118322 RepID=UPI00403DBE99
MSKSAIKYTTRDLKELGLFVEVPGRTDSERTRKKALEEIQRRMDDPEDTSLNSESFADGLSAEDLLVVEPPPTEASEDNEPEIIYAVKAIATLASLRVTLEEANQQAVQLRPLIEALFSHEPLTAEQMQQATDKNFSKSLIKFAEAKAAHDKFLPVAQEAWDVLAPALPNAATEENILPDETEKPATRKASKTPKNE